MLAPVADTNQRLFRIDPGVADGTFALDDASKLQHPALHDLEFLSWRSFARERRAAAVRAAAGMLSGVENRARAMSRARGRSSRAGHSPAGRLRFRPHTVCGEVSAYQVLLERQPRRRRILETGGCRVLEGGAADIGNGEVPDTGRMQGWEAYGAELDGCWSPVL